MTVHGFNDYSKAFEPLAQHLSAELGATLYACDQRGFGANPQPGVWAGSDVLLADLHHITAQVRERHPRTSGQTATKAVGAVSPEVHKIKLGVSQFLMQVNTPRNSGQFVKNCQRWQSA